jgi:hypothetical protein
MLPQMREYFKPAGRPAEIYGGLIVLGTAALLGYFGVRGTIMHLHGSRAAPADPIACAIGIAAGIGGGYIGLRLVLGWREDRALLPTAFLFLSGVAALASAVWFILLNASLHGSTSADLGISYMFGLVGVGALLLWWRRTHGNVPD